MLFLLVVVFINLSLVAEKANQDLAMITFGKLKENLPNFIDDLCSLFSCFLFSSSQLYAAAPSFVNYSPSLREGSRQQCFFCEESYFIL
jgi:hypothetical protein